MIITIAGHHGAGKSTVGRLVAAALGYRFISTGDMRGEIAMEHGMTIDELNAIGKVEAWPHREVDDRIAELGKTEDDIVLDSWLAWHFIPHSKKIFLTVDPRVGAERVFRAQRPDEKHQDSVEGVQAMLEGNMNTWSAGVQKWYGVDFQDRKNYDLVIDATERSAQELAEQILAYVR